MINKKVSGADEAIRDITDGNTLMLGGFGLCGIPENCIAALVKKGVKELRQFWNRAFTQNQAGKKDDFFIRR
jgi:3-oxoacid CoA-transferase subunit A